jgi:predicted dithiol-disulfide oxidoreductase (DUF899 family)
VKPARVVSRDEWTKERRALLAKEKALTRERERLAAARRGLPWVSVEKAYTFEGPDGRETLADLFAGRSQLLVYHFMLDPGGRRAARAAPSGPTTTRERSSTWRRATRRW